MNIMYLSLYGVAAVVLAVVFIRTCLERDKMTRIVCLTEMCGHCEAAVKKALEAVDGVTEAVVSHENGTAVVTLSKEVDNDVLKKAVEDKDYKVTAVK